MPSTESFKWLHLTDLHYGQAGQRPLWPNVRQACGGDAIDWLAGHDACLLLTHQGPEWLDERSREAYPEINPAGRFAAHLFGHMHETVVRSLSQGGGKPLRQWQGCSLFGLEKFGDLPQQDRRHGYGAGRLDFGGDGVTIRFWPRGAVKDGNGWRLVPDHESCVLVDDEGTAPEPVASQLKARAPRRRTTASTPATRPAEAMLLPAYVRAARDLWDIIDLAGLPEEERHLAMQRFVLRQLYVPLRMTVERTVEDESFAALEAHREQLRLAAAGRGSVSLMTEAIKRESLGDWLASVLSASRPRKRTKRSKTEKHPASPTPRLVILGDPGGGKTTLLRWLATACLLRREGSPDLERLPDAETLPEVDWLPILVRCRELDKASVGQCTLEDLLRQTLSKMELSGEQTAALVAVLRDLLEKGRAVLLVDGLDEITDPGARAAFCARLEAVAKRFPAAPMVATSRLVGYREMSRRLGQGFAHATLAELLPEEKDDFVRRWCEVTITDPARREVEAEKLRRGIHGSDRIGRLTTNPMLLTTMALVQRKVGKLPTRRHKLYWEAVDVLLNWRGEVDEPMDPDEVLPQLEYLAYAMCDRGVQRLRRDEVLDLLEGVRRDYPNIRPIHQRSPEELLAQLERRTGLLVEVGEVEHAGRPVPVYEFRHLTFQEYLAALALVDGRFPGRHLEAAYFRHCPLFPVMADPKADPGALRWLGYLMESAKLNEALSACLGLLRHQQAEVRIAAASALGKIADPAAAAGLREVLKDTNGQVRREALGALVRISGTESDLHLLSVHLEAIRPWLDPQEPISLERVRKASRSIPLDETDVRQRYERLADDFGLRLEWRQ